MRDVKQKILSVDDENDILDLMLATAKQKFPMIQSVMIMPDGNFNG